MGLGFWLSFRLENSDFFDWLHFSANFFNFVSVGVYFAFVLCMLVCLCVGACIRAGGFILISVVGARVRALFLFYFYLFIWILFVLCVYVWSR